MDIKKLLSLWMILPYLSTYFSLWGNKTFTESALTKQTTYSDTIEKESNGVACLARVLHFMIQRISIHPMALLAQFFKKMLTYTKQNYNLLTFIFACLFLLLIYIFWTPFPRIDFTFKRNSFPISDVPLFLNNTQNPSNINKQVSF